MQIYHKKARRGKRKKKKIEAKEKEIAQLRKFIKEKLDANKGTSKKNMSTA